MRKLASIQKIINLEPIQNADALEKATILGWEVVVKRGEHKIGDYVVYCEIDSVLPDKPEFEFLRDRKFRIRTIKLRGQVSQGICFPLSILPKTDIEEGKDVTELLGITKYLTPSERQEIKKAEISKSKLKRFMMRYSWFRRLFLSRTKKESFPFWVSKTDEERIQNMPHVLNQFRDHVVYVTEKIDYQSVTFTGQMVSKYPFLGKYSPKKYKFVVCSRNLTVTDKNSLYWRIAKKYNIEKILKENPDLTIQGEQGDMKVQGNKYGLTEPTLWVFNVINHKTGYFLNPVQVELFCDKHNLLHVPGLNACILSEFATTVPELVERSKGQSLIADIPREGIVIRVVENGQKLLSFKVINPDFLLKYSE